MLLRASVFIKVVRQQRALILGSLMLVSAAPLSGCASAGAARVELARQDLHVSAQDFSRTAEQHGWTQPQSSALETLLSGTPQVTLTPADAYLQAKGQLDRQALTQAVILDLGAASTQAETIATLAEACVETQTDATSVRSDLSAIERALILAKRVRMVLSSAVDRVRVEMSPRDAQRAEAQLANLEAQIDRLNAAADKFSDKQLGV